MNWIFIALVSPLAHAVVNHLDKYLISRYVKGGSVGTLILFSALFAVVALPVIVLLEPAVFHSVTIQQAIVLMINGALLVVAIMFYLYALEDEEASYVVPFFQLVPVIGFILGYFLLRETLITQQIMGALLIVAGGVVLSLELVGGRYRLKTKLVLLMLGSSFFYAINAVIFKWIAVDQGFLNSLFWDLLGKFLFGVVLFFCVRSYREAFFNLLAHNKMTIISLNAINEVIALVGEAALVLAVLYAPVALVQSVGGLQPAFVFVLGIVITLLFPKFGKESLERKLLIQKIVGIVIMTVGVYFIEL
jgi:drug/metabolite transporter (DMT)-like permease